MSSLNEHPVISHTWRNRVQTLLLISLLLGISSLAGSLLLGTMGAWLALGASLAALLLAPVASTRLTLAMYRARPISPQQAPELYAMVRQLAERAHLAQAPQLYYVPTTLANAFAVGNRQSAAIAVTDGLLRTLNLHELAGVLAHELAHVIHGDLRVMGLADYVSRLTGVFALAGQFMLLFALPGLLFGYTTINWGGLLLLMLSPHLALLAQLKLSRVREFNADLKAVELTGDPQTLAKALEKIEQADHPWQAILLPGWGNPEPSWLRTHPATEERVQRLQALPSSDSVLWPTHGAQYPQHEPHRTTPRWYPGGLWR